jgi:DNA primase
MKDKRKDPFIVTEGFKACMWTWQSGYQDTVALVGSYLTAEHAELIARAVEGPVILFLDNNEAGVKGTRHAGNLLQAKGVDARVARYPDAREQPDGLTPEEVLCAIECPLSFQEWKKQHVETVSLKNVYRRYRTAS